MQRTLFLTLVASIVLAGCAGTAPTPADLSVAQAEALMAQSVADMPDVFAMDAKVTKGSKELLSIAGLFDNATGTTYLDLKGDLKSLSPRMGGNSPMSGVVGDALALYITKENGTVYFVNGTAFAFAAGATQGMIPSPEQAGAGVLVDPKRLLGVSQGDLNITAVTATTWQGKPAVEVKLTRTMEGDLVDATVVLFQVPARIAHIETTLPGRANNPLDPFAGAVLTADLSYDGDLQARVPAAIRRAAGLAHTTDQPGFPGASLASQNWTFKGGAQVALAEIEARVLNASSASMGPSGPSASQVLWGMKLSERNGSGDGVDLTFTDVDADGTVSQGDVLRIDVASNARVQVALYDTVTRTFVVPGAGLALAALALVGTAALVARRR